SCLLLAGVRRERPVDAPERVGPQGPVRPESTTSGRYVNGCAVNERNTVLRLGPARWRPSPVAYRMPVRADCRGDREDGPPGLQQAQVAVRAGAQVSATAPDVRLKAGAAAPAQDEPRTLYVDGAWGPAVSGGSFEATSPATGQVIGLLSEGGR